jgi:hypothetical protein
MAKRKSTKDIKRSTKYTHKTKNRVIRTPIKTMGEHSCSRRVSSSRSTSDTCRVHLVTNLVISHEWGKDREVLILWHRYSIAVNQVIVETVQLSTLPKETLSSVASLLAATLYQGNPERNHKYRGCIMTMTMASFTARRRVENIHHIHRSTGYIGCLCHQVCHYNHRVLQYPVVFLLSTVLLGLDC